MSWQQRSAAVQYTQSPRSSPMSRCCFIWQRNGKKSYKKQGANRQPPTTTATTKKEEPSSSSSSDSGHNSTAFVLLFCPMYSLCRASMFASSSLLLLLLLLLFLGLVKSSRMSPERFEIAGSQQHEMESSNRRLSGSAPIGCCVNFNGQSIDNQL